MMHKQFSRADRLEDQILQDVADIIYYHVKDPRMGFITLIDVELSKDLKHAVIYYTVLDEKDRLPTKIALESSKGFIRTELSKRLLIYQVPDLTFKYDTSIERSANVSNLIDQISKKNN